jgi:hypothetical protein
LFSYRRVNARLRQSAFRAIRGSITVLTGVLDQCGLHGVLTEIEALGLDLLEVRQLPEDDQSEAP